MFDSGRVKPSRPPGRLGLPRDLASRALPAGSRLLHSVRLCEVAIVIRGSWLGRSGCSFKREKPGQTCPTTSRARHRWSGTLGAHSRRRCVVGRLTRGKMPGRGRRVVIQRTALPATGRSWRNGSPVAVRVLEKKILVPRCPVRSRTGRCSAAGRLQRQSDNKAVGNRSDEAAASWLAYMARFGPLVPLLEEVELPHGTRLHMVVGRESAWSEITLRNPHLGSDMRVACSIHATRFVLATRGAQGSEPFGHK